MKRMLINARQQEELRVALVDGQSLYDLDIEHPGHEQKIANIYKGRVTRIEQSLEAAFIDYGAKRHGFLSFKEIAPEYFVKAPGENETSSHIKDLIKEGQEVVVQIEKEERGTKGAALTTYISLAGGYLVLMPNNPRAGGISRRIEGEERASLRDIMTALKIPEGMGVIVRTAGVSRSQEELDWDLEILIKRWQAIQRAAISRPAPFLIHQESDVVTRAIRDYLRRDISEIIIDDQACFDKVREHISLIRPDFIDHVKLYSDNVPLFNRYQIESQIESAFQHKVQLPAGGSIVIDYTEALVSIDVNSARATKGEDIEETAFNANMEAAQEIARQMRLRDIGGLIVIDFIDMTANRHQRQVEEHLKEALSNDRARVRIGRLSRFGLLEMSRQRLRPSLGEASQIICPRCGGQGNIRGIASQALALIRLIEEEAIKENTAQIQAQLPVKVATFVLNEKRTAIADIEKRHGVNVLVIPNPHMKTPQYTVERLRDSELAAPGTEPPSYRIATEVDASIPAELINPKKEEPAVKNISHGAVKPPARPASKGGLIKRLFGALFGGGKKEKPSTKAKTGKPPARRRPAHSKTSTQNSKRNQSGQKQQRRRPPSGAGKGNANKRTRK